MGRALVIDVGFFGIVVDLLDQRVTAIGAFEQSCEKIDTAVVCRTFHTRVKHLLHAVKVVFADDGLMRPFHDDPFIRRTVAGRFGFVIDLLAFALYHDAGVHQIRKRAADSFITPQGRVADCTRFEIQSLAAFVGRGIEDAVFIEVSHNASDTGAVQVHLENQPDIFGGFLVNHQLVAVGGVFFVSVLGKGADEFAAPTLHVERGADALGVGGDVVFVDHAAHAEPHLQWVEHL